MTKSRNVFFLLILSLSFLVSACSGGLTASSWPGLAVDQNNAYIADNAYVYAVRLSDGTQTWRFPEKAGKGFYATPAFTPDGQLVVGGFDNILYSINPQNGTQNWTFQVNKDNPATKNQNPERWIAGVLSQDQVIYAPSTNHYLYNLDLKGNVLWSFKTNNMLWAQPLVDGQTLYQASMDHNLYAIDVTTHKQLWKTDLGGSVLGTPGISPDKVLYAGSLGNQLFALDAKSGAKKWSFATSGGIWSGPAIMENKVFVGDLNGTIYVVDAASGKQLSKIEGVGSITGSPLIGKNLAVFVTETGNVVATDLSGKQLWTRTINGKLYTTPVLAGDRIVVAVTQGDQLLVSFDQNGNQGWAFATPK